MAYCNKCGYGIGSQGHHDCCESKTSTHTRNGNRINNWEERDRLESEAERRSEEQELEAQGYDENEFY